MDLFDYMRENYKSKNEKNIQEINIFGIGGREQVR